MLKLNVKCTRFEVNIVVVHVGAMKKYVAAVATNKRKAGQNQMKLSLAQKVVHL
jgi:hypothetical protein